MKKEYLDNKILLDLREDDLKDDKILKTTLRKIIKLEKKTRRKNIEITYAIKENTNQKISNNIEIILELNKIKTKKKRTEYIYDKTCEYLDNEIYKKNYCDFKNDVCIAKRNPIRGKEVKMGCCYHVNIFSNR